jgi:hypothetical protein
LASFYTAICKVKWEEAWAGVYEEKEEGHIRAYSVGELLKKIGWATVDYVKCDIEGCEAEVFSEPHCA